MGNLNFVEVLGLAILLFGVIIGVIAGTKAMWQWIFGTDVLIKLGKEQVELLREMKKRIGSTEDVL